MNQFYLRFLLLLTLSSAYFLSDAQCVGLSGCAVPVQRSLDRDTLLCGEVDTIIANPSSSILAADFNAGVIPVGWSDNSSSQFDNPCLPSLDGSTYMWMGNIVDQPRTMQTVNFDLSTFTGGSICFDFVMSEEGGPLDVGGAANNCEGPDQADEGVFLQFSTNDGTTWNNIFYFNPDTVCCGCPAGGCSGTGNSPFIDWNNYCFSIPPGALDTCVSFRWFQELTSDNEFDHWGLDNVTITTTGGTTSTAPYELIWLNDTTDTDSMFIFDANGFTGDTTITVIYTNNVDDTCITEINYFIPPTDAGPDIVAACDDGLGEQLSVSGATTVAWFPDYELDDIFSLTPITTTIVDTTYVVQSFCDRDTINVDVVSTITPTAVTSSGTDVDTICLFGSSTLSVTANIPIDSVVWRPNIELSATDATTVTASPLADQTYIVEVWSVGGCNKTDTVQVVVGPPQPFVETTGDTTICVGESLQLNTQALSAAGVVDCASPNVLSLGDDQLSTGIPLPFSFDFFGNTFNEVFVSSNGFITFDAASGSDLGNSPIPTGTAFGARDFIALGWDDLDPGGGAGTISWCIEGTAPNRQFIVTYDSVPHFPGFPNETITTQAILFEGSNVIQINNIDVQNDGGGMTQGIGNSDGTLGQGPAAYSNQPFTAVDESWLYIPTSDTTYDLIATTTPGGGGGGSGFTFNWTALTGSTADLSSTTIADPVFTGTTTSTYIVEATPTGTDCTASDTVTITVTPDFTWTLTATEDTICRNQTTALTITPDNTYPGYTFVWEPDDNSLDTLSLSTVNASPDNTTTYTVTMTGVGGCVNSDSIEIVVAGEAPPPVTFNSVGPICDGFPVTLTATVGQGETITDDFEGPGCFDPTVWSNVVSGDCRADCGTPSGSGSALHFDGPGTPGTDRVAETVPIDASVGGTISFDLQIGSGGFGAGCENADAGEDVALQYSIDGGTTWVDIAVYDESLFTGWLSFSEPIPPAAQTSSTLFRWSQIAFSSCTSCDEWSIDNIVIDAGCFGPSCGNFDYLYYPNLGDISNDTDSSTLIIPSSSRWFYLDVTVPGTDCSITDSIFVRVNELAYEISDSIVICQGDSALAWVDAGANVNYTWSPASVVDNPMEDSVMAFPDTSMWIVVQMDSLAGCSDTDSIFASIDQPQQIPLIASDPDLTICPDSSLTLSVAPTYASYLWAPSGVTSPELVVNSAGSYSAQLTSALGCVDFTDTLTVSIAPVSQLIGWGNDTEFCLGDSAVITAPSGLADVEWFRNGTFVGNGNSITAASTGNYSFTFRTDQGCLNTAEPVAVTVNGLPLFDVSSLGNNILCCTDDSIIKNLASIITSPLLSDLDQVLWNGNPITISPSMLVGLDEGVDSFTVIDNNGCTQTATFVTERFCANPTVDGDTVTDVGSPVSFDLSHDSYGPNDSVSYQWLPGLLSDNNAPSPLFTPTAPGTYTFTGYVTTVIDPPGVSCVDSVNRTVTVIEPVVPAIVPAAFSPNGDGLNDVFQPIVSAGTATITALRIFNRWGEEVYNTPDDSPWDGTASGIAQPVGSYVYYLTVTYADGSEETFAGSVSLIR